MNRATSSSKKLTVGDIAAKTRNSLAGGPFGSDLGGDDYVASGVPVIRGQNMGDRFVRGPFVFVSLEKANALKKNAAYPGDIIFTQRGSLGQVSLVPNEPYDMYIVSQSQMKLTPDFDRVDAGYLFQYFSSPRLQFFIKNSAIQTGIPHTNLGILRDTPVDLPSLSEQRTIANIFSVWDDGIELTERRIAVNRKLAHSILQRHVDLAGENWSLAKLGELFKNRKAKGEQGLPTYSVTMNAGLVRRDSLDRKNDTTLEPEQHLLIEEGDMAYNMMRMWQGASGLATEAGLVSPAYVVIRSRGKVDPAFASYWFKMPRVVKKFQDYSHGLTKDRLRLYYKDFATIALPLPPLKLQQQIAEAMQCCDRELDVLKRKVALLKQQKKGLMQQLLTGKTRVKLPKGAA